MRVFRSLAALSVSSIVLIGASCAPAHNYSGPGPRYAGGWIRAAALPSSTLKVVSFNIRFAIEIDRALELLRDDPVLRDADVIALQEMDAPGTERIAQALGCEYIYYPAAELPEGKDFGNAVLVRGEIVEDHKVVLPHPGRFGGMQRIAVATTVLVRSQPLRVYSVHLGTPKDVSAASRRDQVRAIVEDARSTTEPVVIAGDFNNRDVIGESFVRSGFDWATRGIGRTISLFSWDHVFVRGLDLASLSRRGVGANNHASDHRPVWVELSWRAGGAAASTAVAAP
jgi:endonuclease/exonuclease/phosphatase family metal-dependent hydrolase